MSTSIQPTETNDDKLLKDLKGQVVRTGKDSFAQGANADVYRGEWRDESGATIIVAIKILRGVHIEPDRLKDTKRRLNRETGLWHDLIHPNVLRFLGVCSDIEASPAMISPFCGSGNVLDYLNENKNVDKLAITIGIARGMEYLHSRDVVHGDMKPHHVLMGDDGQPKICDFGCSKILDRRGFTTRFQGSEHWMAPELTDIPDDLDAEDSEPFTPDLTKASDVFAFAMVALEVLTGKGPFHNFTNNVVVLLKIKAGRRPSRGGHGSLDPVLWAILEDSWAQSPEVRPGMKIVLDRLIRARS